MKTNDGYEVKAGMMISTMLDDDVAYQIQSVSDDTAVYHEYIWNEEDEDFKATGDGGLLWAEEIENLFVYMI